MTLKFKFEPPSEKTCLGGLHLKLSNYASQLDARTFRIETERSYYLSSNYMISTESDQTGSTKADLGLCCLHIYIKLFFS